MFLSSFTDGIHRRVRRWINGSGLVGLTIVISACPARSSSENRVIVPQRVTEMLVNPGKGWIAYGLPGDHSEDTLALCAVGYKRFEWATLNPAEGVYHWQSIDRALSAWKQAGKQFAFGVMALSSHSATKDGYSTPRWVFDRGAKGSIVSLPSDSSYNEWAGVRGPKMVPDFSNPIFQKELERFYRALAARYDGNPDIAFIDVRTYGNWGEGHLYPFNRLAPRQVSEVDSTTLRRLLHLAQDSFRRTQLIVPWGASRYQSVYEEAVAEGMGLRRDGICGNSDGSELAPAFGKQPIVFEFFGTYSWLKEKGWWDGHKSDGHGFRLADAVERGRPSWIGLSLGEDGDVFARAEPVLIAQLGNRMGYHLALTRAEVPLTMPRDQAVRIKLRWVNDGVAPMHIRSALAFALLDTQDQAVETVWPEGVSPVAWGAGRESDVDVPAVFSKAAPDRYRFAVGLVEQKGSSRPIIRLGIAGRTDTGWYPLCEVNVR